MIVSSSRWNSKRAGASIVRRGFRLHSRRHADTLLHHRRRPHLCPLLQSSIMAILFCSLPCSWPVWPSLHRLSTGSFWWPAVRGRRPLERRNDPLEGSQQWWLYAQSRRGSWANVGLGGDPQVSQNTTAEAVRYHVRFLCLGGGFPVTWWGDLWCLAPRWRPLFRLVRRVVCCLPVV